MGTNPSNFKGNDRPVEMFLGMIAWNFAKKSAYSFPPKPNGNMLAVQEAKLAGALEMTRQSWKNTHGMLKIQTTKPIP